MGKDLTKKKPRPSLSLGEAHLFYMDLFDAARRRSTALFEQAEVYQLPVVTSAYCLKDSWVHVVTQGAHGTIGK